MKRDLILSGVGGQGILSISFLICHAALEHGLRFKQAEVHGMAQRGGAVQSHLRLSDTIIHSDLIPSGQAHLILSVEPLEVFRYLPYLRPDGIVITATEPFINIPNYPESATLDGWLNQLPRKILIDAKGIAQQIGNPRVANTVILGASAPTLGFEPGAFDTGLDVLFGKKGDKIVAVNREAVRAGYEVARGH
ncbi:indolepyruvate oxidoreductase subunit beta [bacterium]|nr:indolepyruvate oxidoreductase subunit beta [candidate division CSSED10-310 bacterium]